MVRVLAIQYTAGQAVLGYSRRSHISAETQPNCLIPSEHNTIRLQCNILPNQVLQSISFAKSQMRYPASRLPNEKYKIKYFTSYQSLFSHLYKHHQIALDYLLPRSGPSGGLT